MNCTRVQQLLVDFLYEELNAGERASLTTHLEGCADCQVRWTRIQRVASAADRWSAPPAPRGIAERALVRVAAEQHADAERRSIFSSAAVGRLLVGGGLALASLAMVAWASNLQVSLSAGVLAVTWAVLYSGVLLASRHPSIRGLTGAALVGAGVALLLVPVLAIPSVVEACARWVREAQASAPLAIVLLIVAAGYTAAPLLIGTLAAGTTRDRRGAVDGLKLAGLYALLIAPAVYLQCLPLPLEVTALWMAGALLGVAAGGPASIRLRGWLRRAA